MKLRCFKYHLLLFIILANYGFSQDVEQIIKSKPIEINGGISAGINFYADNGQSNTISPFGYSLIGRLNLSIYSFQIPMSVSLMDSRFNYSGSFNRFNINPKYKWVQLYLGNNSYNFSPYVLSGQNIKGYGLKLTPGNFSLTIVKGTINNFIPQKDTLTYGTVQLPTYKRNVLAGQFGMKTTKFTSEISILKAIDKLQNNVFIPQEYTNTIRPSENFALGLKVSTTLWRALSLGFNLGTSIISDDKTQDGFKLQKGVEDVARLFLSPNNTTRIGLAGDGFLRIRIKRQSIGLSYKRIEPGYKSLGLYYIQGDNENITVNTRLSLFRSKITASGSVGIQRNNLNSLRLHTSVRNIFTGTVGYNAKKLNIQATHSNFSLDQRAGLIEVNDTIRIGQVTNNSSLVVGYNMPNDIYTDRISINFNKFGLKEVSLRENKISPSTNQIINLNYNRRYKASKLTFVAGFNFGLNESNGSKTNRIGGMVSSSKELKSGIKISLGSNINKIVVNNRVGMVFNTRLSTSYALNKKHMLNASLYNVIRTFTTNGRATNTLRGRINYSFNF